MQSWAVELQEQRARMVPHPRIGRSFSWPTSSRMAWFSSTSEKKRRLRSRARIQRWHHLHAYFDFGADSDDAARVFQA